MKRVLIDKHHAGLFNALQRLFEDRLGCIVYTPVGHEWWDAGYWQFGHGYGDDRLARQFLQLDGWECLTPDQAPGYRTYRWHDPHYPEREVLGVELGAVTATPKEWTYIVATVQDNQHGFARLADELGAKYVLQVGNVNQDVDWKLDPLALVSAEQLIRGRGVYHHQEFDSDGLFAYADPIGTRRAASFVNCFDSTPCYRWAQDAAGRMAVAIHGIDGRDGNVTDIADVARIMRNVDWGWHDKVQGDGFGHVIHMWAALGRPLIGHGSHYHGLMASPFWEDGVTCIDLDKHSVDKAVDRVLTIPPDEYRAMSLAIRARFDELVDWDAEAEAIRALLA